MGLDVYIKLVVGVPLDRLGEIREVKEVRALFNKWGQPTGKEVTIGTVYLDINGTSYEIGSNEDRLHTVDYHYQELFENDTEYESWLHMVDLDASLDQIIVGLVTDAEFRGRDIGRFESYSASILAEIQEKILLVKETLDKKFDYTGEVFVIAMPRYSY